MPIRGFFNISVKKIEEFVAIEGKYEKFSDFVKKYHFESNAFTSIASGTFFYHLGRGQKKEMIALREKLEAAEAKQQENWEKSYRLAELSSHNLKLVYKKASLGVTKADEILGDVRACAFFAATIAKEGSNGDKEEEFDDGDEKSP